MNAPRVLLLASLLISAPLNAKDIVDIFPRVCKPGVHEQPNGPFALYVFCDDALGTNIVVFYKGLGDPQFEKYTLGKRFWQGESWANDVTSYVWLKDGRHLVIATSYIYGTGSVYLLDLETQQFQAKKPIPDGACLSRLRQINEKRLIAGVTNCEHTKEYDVEFTF